MTDHAGQSNGWQQVGTFTVPSPAPPANVSVSPNAGSGATQSFVFTASSASGGASINQVQVIFNWSLWSAGACYLWYDRATNLFTLDYSATIAPGASGGIENGQCTLSGAGSSAVVSGNNLVITLALSFKPSFIGPQQIWMTAYGFGGLNSPWQQMGSWTGYPAPYSQPASAVSVTPNGGAGMGTTFALVSSDLNGAAYIPSEYIAFGPTSTTTPPSCTLVIYHSGNLAYLINDDGSVWTYVPPGGSVSNSQCTINGTSGSDSGNNWTFNVSVTFQPGYVGAAKPISLYVIDHAGQSYGWQQVGTYTVSGPPAGTHRTGVKSTGSYWGAAGEQIDLLSGNLSYSIPLIQARGRGGPGMNFTLSYNSQIWQQSGGTTSLLGRDLGFGLGWTLQAGSLLQVLNSYYIFTDSTGAQYKLDQNSNGVWTSRDSVYIAYDSAYYRLFFPDGTFWMMTVQSETSEADAGTLYPFSMMDPNGNSILIQYGPAGGTTVANTSGRVTQITDNRALSGAVSYQFSYTYLNVADLYPHLTGISSNVGSGENYSFSYGSGVALSSPFTSTAFGSAAVLQGVTVPDQGGAYNLAYGLGTGELTQASIPAGGSLAWVYRTYTYAGSGLSFREVKTRQMTASAGTTSSWNIKLGDNDPLLHAAATVEDVGANSSKVWTFAASGTTQGLAASYEERGPTGAALQRAVYTWLPDTAGNLYVSSVVNTRITPLGQAQSMSTQILDQNGNITASAVYDYGNLTTPARTYTYTYLNDSNYAPRHILNRVTQVTMNGTVLVTNTYDNYWTTCGGAAGMGLRGFVPLHDDVNYGTSFWYRGNVTSRSSPGGSVSMRYESTGVVVCGEDGAGHAVTSAPSADTNYSLPGVLTPGGNTNLETRVAYAGSWAVTSLTGPNGANGTTTYDGNGRPVATKIPDGAETTYSYAYAAMGNQQTAMLGTGTTARWKRTTVDGFGRVTKVENGNGPSTNAPVSQVDTQYAPCGCSPLGKVSKVSMPHAPGGTVVWTEYSYDGSGRTVQVKAPDGSLTQTEYLTEYPESGTYKGNLVRVTDAAKKWKIQQTNAMGQLVRVIEPNPVEGGADWITEYTYDVLGHLTGVSMPRGGAPQTRTFVYTGADLTSATNPENGTVTYQYDASHKVTKRTDAKGQETRYVYDAYGRLTQVQHWALIQDWHTGQYVLTEQGQQRVDYSYDSNPLNGSYSQNTWGRLAAVQFHDENAGTPFAYMYSYNQAGRVTAQHMDYDMGTQNPLSFDATYSWDNEGRMTGTNYGPQYTFQYDANGRLSGMQDVAAGNMTVATASYGVAGEITGLSYNWYNQWSYSETRQYNAMLQLTRMTGTGTPYGSPPATVLDMQYDYTLGANNGRIAQAVDWVTGETVAYGYDPLNRLTTAGATNGSWAQSYSYDGFGNLTGKTQGGVPVLNVGFDAATNRQNGLTYDLNGNVGTGAYDVENRVITDASGSYSYDPMGKRVKKGNGVAFEFYFYGIGGQKLVTLCLNREGGLGCPVGNQYNAYFGGRSVKSKGVAVVTDRLGSVRANSNGERMSYYPYGEERTSTADGREKFATYTRDNAATDYADQRYYAVGVGRFNSADPYQASNGGAGDATDPASWNRYAFVAGDEGFLNFV